MASATLVVFHDRNARLFMDSFEGSCEGKPPATAAIRDAARRLHPGDWHWNAGGAMVPAR